MESAEDLNVAEPAKKQRLQLTREQAMSIDLVFTKKRLALAEERLAFQALREAQKKLHSLVREEAIMLNVLEQSVGGRLRNAKLVGDHVLEYEIEG